MNRIETHLAALKEENKKAFITYMTAGLPDMETCEKIIKCQCKAGVDIIELGVPFSDPIADGPVIQDASYHSILKGTNLTRVFDLVEKVRKDCSVPIVFMLYYNTILCYGIKKFTDKCREAGVDGFIIPDLPMEETFEIKEFLADEEAPFLIPLVSPVSKDRIPRILEDAKGFVYCVSSMGVTGQKADFHKNIESYLEGVRAASKLPVMLGFGIRTAADVKPYRNMIDGCITGSHFIKLMENNEYDCKAIEEYITEFKSAFH
jgi:tryptophan synthase, alpha subunit